MSSFIKTYYYVLVYLMDIVCTARNDNLNVLPVGNRNEVSDLGAMIRVFRKGKKIVEDRSCTHFRISVITNRNVEATITLTYGMLGCDSDYIKNNIRHNDDLMEKIFLGIYRPSFPSTLLTFKKYERHDLDGIVYNSLCDSVFCNNYRPFFCYVTLQAKEGEKRYSQLYHSFDGEKLAAGMQLTHEFFEVGDSEALVSSNFGIPPPAYSLHPPMNEFL